MPEKRMVPCRRFTAAGFRKWAAACSSTLHGPSHIVCNAHTMKKQALLLFCSALRKYAESRPHGTMHLCLLAACWLLLPLCLSEASIWFRTDKRNLWQGSKTSWHSRLSIHQWPALVMLSCCGVHCLWTLSTEMVDLTSGRPHADMQQVSVDWESNSRSREDALSKPGAFLKFCST